MNETHISGPTREDTPGGERAEEALRKKERYLSLILDSVPALIWQKDNDGRYRQVNQAYCDAVGLEKESIVGKTDYDLFPTDIADKYVSDDQEVLRTHTARREIEEHHLKPSGEYGWSLTHKMPLWDADGNVEGTIGFALDITERKRYEAELRQAHALLDSIIENIPNMVFLKDARDLRFVRINRAVEELVGYARSELLGKNDYDFFPREQADFFTRKDREVLIGKVLVDIPEEPIETRDKGVRLLHTRKVPILNENGEPEYLLGISYDITERKEMEAQRFQIQKAESLGRMAGAIAHHFNNQLQVVMGNLQMAMNDLGHPEQAVQSLTEAMGAARKAARVSGQMLAYLGQTAGRRETLDLAETCRQNLALLQAALPKNVIVKTDMPTSGPWVHVNSNDIRQVLTSLATNAWESMVEAGGSLHFAIDTVAGLDIPKSHRFPIEWAPEHRGYAFLEVRDTGSGIADADIEKLFDPFFSTKFTGRGLGLPVVLGIVRAHGGCIAVESRVGGQESGVGGQGSETLGVLVHPVDPEDGTGASLRENCMGSVFRVYLPLSAETVPQHPEKVAKFQQVQAGGLVLLVEDTEQVRKLGVRMLEYLGCRVIAAKDGVEGVEIFRERSEEIKFVLSDLTMPRMDGWATIAALREIDPNVRIILASGYDEASVMSGDHAERPQAFLAKPYSLEDLRTAIGKVI